MAPPRLVFVLVSVLSLTLFLTFISLIRSHPRHYTAAESATSTEQSSFRSLFSFRTPSALFPSSAIISLTDDNSTFFLARPADFGPNLPADGLSGQLWVGSGFGDDNLGRGLVTEAEGELGCSDVPGWRHGRKLHQGDGQFEPSAQADEDKFSDKHQAHLETDHLELSVQDLRRHRDDQRTIPSEVDGTDDHLHHPLPDSQVSRPTLPGHAADVEHPSSGQPAQHADIQSLQESAEISGKLVLLSRGGCGFLEKVKWVQRRGGVGLIIGDNTRGGALVTMYARGDTSNVTIPALFTSRTTAHLLSSLIPPDLPDSDSPMESGMPGHQPHESEPHSTHTKANEDRPIFTSTASLPKATRTASAKSPPSHRTPPKEAQRSWFRSLFGLTTTRSEEYADQGAMEDSRRPSSSSRLTWINEQWTETASSPGKDNANAAREKTRSSDSKNEINNAVNNVAGASDGFEIGVHDWRDPDLVRMGPTSSASTSVSGTASKVSTSTGGIENDRLRSESGTVLSGGSITPSSGEYRGVGAPGATRVKSSKGTFAESHDNSHQGQSWFGRLLQGNRDEITHASHESSQAASGLENDRIAISGDHEGLWVTLTPTTVSTSPFFDTLLVLVVSPLITLTVVYSLLLIRSRIRRRRWRAPKSVVERLPIRTYHTMSCSSTTSSSQLATPRASSPTSPLLQNSSRSITSRSRPRSYTASGIGEAISDSLDKATSRASMKQRETAAGRNVKNKQYHGKQLECVVCLEEYVDGQSKVMSLPCGHEFHAECITPWLTTRRRTCPICKGDVVRSLAKTGEKSSDPSAQPNTSEPVATEDVQTQAAETSNDSPTAAIPIPRDISDLERGDDMAATLVNEPPETSSSRRGWRGLASFSLSAFSGEAAWRQAQADRNR
ncbi:MAG: hypothetical protein Q9220_006952 [cf. Caloplaca sp. 1 TL-2023]